MIVSTGDGTRIVGVSIPPPPPPRDEPPSQFNKRAVRAVTAAKQSPAKTGVVWLGGGGRRLGGCDDGGKEQEGYPKYELEITATFK